MSNSDRSLSFETRPLSSLVPDPGNLKRHPDSQIDHLCASIRRFGFNDPIGITPEGLIVEGHGRYEAAQRLGLTEVPVLILSGLTERERQGYAIAHNQTTMNTGLDADLVRAEFIDLGVGDADYPAVGYSEDDVLFLSDAFADLNANNATDHNGHEKENLNKLLPRVFRSVVPFQSEEDYADWERLILACRSQYFTGGSIGERMLMFVAEYEASSL